MEYCPVIFIIIITITTAGSLIISFTENKPALSYQPSDVVNKIANCNTDKIEHALGTQNRHGLINYREEQAFICTCLHPVQTPSLQRP